MLQIKQEYSIGVYIPLFKKNGNAGSRYGKPDPEEVAKERFNRLLEHVNSGVEKVSEGMVGTVEKVLVEDINRQDGNMLTGRTERNSLVHFEGSAGVNRSGNTC